MSLEVEPMKMEFLNGKGWRKTGAGWIVCMAFFLAALFFSIPVQALSDDEVKAPSAVLLEPQTGKVLYAKNADEPHQWPP